MAWQHAWAFFIIASIVFVTCVSASTDKNLGDLFDFGESHLEFENFPDQYCHSEGVAEKNHNDDLAGFSYVDGRNDDHCDQLSGLFGLGESDNSCEAWQGPNAPLVFDATQSMGPKEPISQGTNEQPGPTSKKRPIDKKLRKRRLPNPKRLKWTILQDPTSRPTTLVPFEGQRVESNDKNKVTLTSSTERTRDNNAVHSKATEVGHKAQVPKFVFHQFTPEIIAQHIEARPGANFQVGFNRISAKVMHESKRSNDNTPSNNQVKRERRQPFTSQSYTPTESKVAPETKLRNRDDEPEPAQDPTHHGIPTLNKSSFDPDQFLL